MECKAEAGLAEGCKVVEPVQESPVLPQVEDKQTNEGFMLDEEWEKEVAVVQSSNEYVYNYDQTLFENNDHKIIQINAKNCRRTINNQIEKPSIPSIIPKSPLLPN